MTRRRVLSIALVTAALVAAGAGSADARAAEAAVGDTTVIELHFAMATPVRIAARGAREPAVRTAVRAAFAEIKRLEGILSTFDPDSDASRLNRSGGEPVPVAAELAGLLATSSRLSRSTDGAFSVLVGPLLDAWRAALASGGSPESAELGRALELTRPELVTFQGSRVALGDRGARIDLGGIAKGFAADRAIACLRRGGVSAAIVDLGGSSIAAFGDAGDGASGWPVAIPTTEHRGEGEPASDRVLRLHDGALSTSASFGRSLVAGSGRGHIVDPRDGHLLDADAMAVVRHRAATDAEALSKALLVLDGDAAPVLAAAGAEGLLLGGDARARCTAGFRSVVPDCTVLGPRRIPQATKRG